MSPRLLRGSAGISFLGRGLAVLQTLQWNRLCALDILLEKFFNYLNSYVLSIRLDFSQEMTLKQEEHNAVASDMR